MASSHPRPLCPAPESPETSQHQQPPGRPSARPVRSVVLWVKTALARTRTGDYTLEPLKKRPDIGLTMGNLGAEWPLLVHEHGTWNAFHRCKKTKKPDVRRAGAFQPKSGTHAFR